MIRFEHVSKAYLGGRQALQAKINALQRLSPTEIGFADVFKANHC